MHFDHRLVSANLSPRVYILYTESVQLQYGWSRRLCVIEPLSESHTLICFDNLILLSLKCAVGPSGRCINNKASDILVKVNYY
jgi:hypothetical protein